MPYWVLVVLAVSAGLLFGAARPAWPWRQRHPVRRTVLLVIPVASLTFLVVTKGVVGWPQSHTGTRWLLAGIWLVNFPGLLLGPKSAWERWASVLLYIAAFAICVFWWFS